MRSAFKSVGIAAIVGVTLALTGCRDDSDRETAEGASVRLDLAKKEYTKMINLCAAANEALAGPDRIVSPEESLDAVRFLTEIDYCTRSTYGSFSYEKSQPIRLNAGDTLLFEPTLIIGDRITIKSETTTGGTGDISHVGQCLVTEYIFYKRTTDSKAK